MGDVLKFKDPNDFDECTYFGLDGEIGVALRDRPLSIMPVGKKDVDIDLFDRKMTVSRADLAEFIHVARALIDPEDRWAVSGELVSIKYD